jgi:hypothetical protein
VVGRIYKKPVPPETMVLGQANRVRLQLTATDVSRMEAALVWPGHYLRERPLILRIVQ